MLSLILAVIALLLAVAVLIGLLSNAMLAASVVLLAICTILDHAGFVTRRSAP